MAVYPRWRGEHCFCPGHRIFQHGLSPLARGTQSAHADICVFRRFIPVGAGNTSPQLLDLPRYAVYPRWRGEHIANKLSQLHTVGLSPLARGTRDTAYSNASRMRFIPAGAGNTQTIAIRNFSITVYPRWRGEHVGEGVFNCPFQRFIPAGAGNTLL